MFQYIEISDVDPLRCVVRAKSIRGADAPSRARNLVHAGDVLVSTVRPERRTVGVVQEDQEGAVCTTGFAVLRPQGIDSFTLAYLLKTDFVNSQIMRNNVGIAYPAVDEQCLVDILLPIRRENLPLLKERVDAFASLERQARTAREAYSNQLASAVAGWTESPLILDSKPRQSS
jgi:type I restriction enzyme S subunit